MQHKDLSIYDIQENTVETIDIWVQSSKGFKRLDSGALITAFYLFNFSFPHKIMIDKVTKI